MIRNKTKRKREILRETKRNESQTPYPILQKFSIGYKSIILDTKVFYWIQKFLLNTKVFFWIQKFSNGYKSFLLDTRVFNWIQQFSIGYKSFLLDMLNFLKQIPIQHKSWTFVLKWTFYETNKMKLHPIKLSYHEKNSQIFRMIQNFLNLRNESFMLNMNLKNKIIVQ